MDADTMAARHKTVIARYARQVADDGNIPGGLLAELRAVADEHADGVLGENLAATVPAEAPQGRAETPDAQSPAPVPVKPRASGSAPARRTRTRTR